jgi:hypothetical protein
MRLPGLYGFLTTQRSGFLPCVPKRMGKRHGHVEKNARSGGNLVAVDANGDPMAAIFPTAFTQLVTAASAAPSYSQAE